MFKMQSLNPFKLSRNNKKGKTLRMITPHREQILQEIDQLTEEQAFSLNFDGERFTLCVDENCCPPVPSHKQARISP